jgi:ATP-dependent helicase IRC3
MSALALRDYQLEALAAVAEAERRGVFRQLVVLPTGTGKTVVFSHLRKLRGGRTLVLAHRDELLRQAVDKLRMVDPSAVVGVVKADEDQVSAPTVVASIQTLAQPARLARLVPNFTTVIVDEAHHAAAETYGRVLEHVGALGAAGPLLVGFTATPERGDKVGLSEVFQEIVYQRGILPMIQAGYLADLRAVQVQLEADFSALRVQAGDFVERELEAALLACDAPEQALEAYQEHAAGRKAPDLHPNGRGGSCDGRRLRLGRGSGRGAGWDDTDGPAARAPRPLQSRRPAGDRELRRPDRGVRRAVGRLHHRGAPDAIKAAVPADDRAGHPALSGQG